MNNEVSIVIVISKTFVWETITV